MGIMALLVGVSLPNLFGLGEAQKLVNAGNLVVDLANQARQNSIDGQRWTRIFAQSLARLLLAGIGTHG